MASRISLIKENIILLVFVLLINSCGNETSRRLHDADAVMEENPDSALMILTSIDTLSISSRDLPYYALLLTQARVKTRTPSPSDSLIRIALHEYDGAWRGDKGIRANHYMGEVLDENGDPRGAMKHFLSAYEESKRLGNDYWRAKSAERISDLFFDAYNYDEAERYNREAIEFFGTSGRITNQRYSLGALGILYINNHKIKQAEQLLDSLYKVCSLSLPADSALIGYVRRPMIDILLETGRTNEITEADYELIHNTSSDEEQIDAAILLNKISQSAEDTIGFRSGLEEAKLLAFTNEYKALLFYECFRSEKTEGNLSAALSYVDSLLFYQCALAEDILKESVTSAQRDYYSDLSKYQKKKNNFVFAVLGITILFFAVAFTFIWRINRLKAKVQKAEIEDGLKEIILLKTKCDRISAENKMLSESNIKNGKIMDEMEKAAQENANTISQLNALKEDRLREEEQHGIIIEKLFREKWTTLNHLCDEYFERGDTEKAKNTILTNIEKELSKVCSRKGMSQIVESVDTYMGGIITMIRKEIPDLKNMDIEFLALIYAGFSTKAVCMFMDIKTGNFYTKRRRLTKKIGESNAIHKDIFLNKMQ